MQLCFLTLLPAGWGQFDPLPSGLLSVALKPYELLSLKVVTFPKYEFNTFSQNFSSINDYFVYFTGTFCRLDRFRSLLIMCDHDHDPINNKIDLDFTNADITFAPCSKIHVYDVL